MEIASWCQSTDYTWKEIMMILIIVIPVSYPINLHYLESLRNISCVGWQSRSSWHKPHEKDSLLIWKFFQGVPEPLHQLMLLINFSVSHNLLQNLNWYFWHSTDHLLQLLGSQKGQQRNGHNPRHPFPDSSHLMAENRRDVWSATLISGTSWTIQAEKWHWETELPMSSKYCLHTCSPCKDYIVSQNPGEYYRYF